MTLAAELTFDFALPTVATEFGMAENRLNIALRNLFDSSIHQYVVAQRIKYAKQCLEQSAKPRAKSPASPATATPAALRTLRLQPLDSASSAE